MTARASFPWGRQAVMSSWAYAVLLVQNIAFSLLTQQSFYNVIPRAGAHHSVWDVKLTLLLLIKACHFQGDWILASQRGGIRQQVSKGPKWTWIKNMCWSQGKEEYSPTSVKERLCFFLLWTSELGTGMKCWDKQNFLISLMSSLSGLVWLTDRKSEKASWDLNL